MAIQTTSNLEYNYGTYLEPYFRLVLHLPINGQQTPVDCFMYSSIYSFYKGLISSFNFLKHFSLTSETISDPIPKILNPISTVNNLPVLFTDEIIFFNFNGLNILKSKISKYQCLYF
jgi:hypothetical protein